MADKEPWYMGLRAESLLMVHLTRRDDLVVRVTRSDDTGLDCLVTITRDHRDTGRVFGVILKASRSLRPSVVPGDAGYKLPVKLRPETIPKDVPFPLCLIVFSMDDDQGYYRWIKRPILNPSGQANLRLHEDERFAKLDSDAIDTIVQEVVDWYQARSQGIAAYPR